MENGQEFHKLRTLLKVGAAVAAELDLEKAVQLVTDAATELTGAAFGAFFYNVLNEKGESYMLYTISGVPKEAFSNFPMPRNTAVFGPTFAGEGIVRSDDIMKDPRYGKSAPYYGQPKGHLPVHSYLAVPVVSRSGEVVGGLFFGHPETGKFTQEHEEIVLGIAAQAAIAIDNARLYRAAQQEIERRRKVEDILRSNNAVLEASSESDYTQARQALAKLRDGERLFKLLVQSVTDYAIYMLDPEGVIASWNAGAERIKGYKPHEIMGRNYAEFFTPEDRDAGIPGNALKVAAEHGRYESQGWRLRKDGSRFWSLAVIDAVRDEQGELLGFAKITRDMTEQRVAQLRLERAQEQLAQSQKMEAIGHLTGGIAHDFNNLLMIVSGQAQLMKKRATNPKDVRSIDAIEQAAQSGANLTRQLLTFARRQRLNRISIDVGERLAAIHDLLASSIGRAVKLGIDIAPDTWPVETDVGEFELALVNIAVNASDAMPHGGEFRVTARNISFDADEATLLTGDFVALSLADTGEGIPPDVLSRIFEPFFTTKDIGKGTGLGLSQVYGFARQSGGDVHVSSRQGEGTTVTLYLPRSHGAATAIAPQPVASEDVRGEGRILLVEDNPQVSDVSTLLLEQLGYGVEHVDRPAAALDILGRENDFILVFSDIVMPGEVDGLTLAHTIRERFPDLPVLLATGYSSAAERAGGEFPILRKPYDQNALGRAVKIACATSTHRKHVTT